MSILHLKFTETESQNHQDCWSFSSPACSCQRKVSYSRSSMATSRQVCSISKVGDFMASLCNLCQCLITLTVKEKKNQNQKPRTKQTEGGKKSAFMCLNGILCAFICAHCLMSCQWAPLRSLAPPSSFPPTRYLYTLIR